jgi:hypothetical protein
VGLALLVGPNVAIDSRVLGLARGVPLASLDRYFGVAWLGFGLNAASGILLLISYPTKALTNPLFYLKLALIGAAIVLMQAMRREMRRTSDTDLAMPHRLKMIAAVSLGCWAASITAGRLLAYTYTRLLVDEWR